MVKAWSKLGPTKNLYGRWKEKDRGGLVIRGVLMEIGERSGQWVKNQRSDGYLGNRESGILSSINDIG